MEKGHEDKQGQNGRPQNINSQKNNSNESVI